RAPSPEVPLKIQIALELTPRVKRAFLVVTGASVLLFGGAAAYAQTVGTNGDTRLGAALNTLGSVVAGVQAQLVALQGADRTARATIAASGTVLTQNGKWLS